MKEWLTKMWRKKYAVVGLVLVLALLPFAVTREPEALSKTVVTTIGIARDNGEIQIVAEHIAFAFEHGARPEREIITARGSTLGNAIANMGTSNGREVSLSHCTVIVVHDNLGTTRDEVLWELYRRPDLSNSSAVFTTSNDIEAVIQTSNDDGDGRSGLLGQIARYRQNKQSGRNADDNLLSIVRKTREGREINIPRITLEDEQLKVA